MESPLQAFSPAKLAGRVLAALNGPQSFVLTKKMNAPPQEVFRQVSEPECMTKWGGAPITRVRDSQNTACGLNGPGSVRSVNLGLLTMEETILSSDPPHGYEYTITKGNLVKNHRGKVSISPDGAGSLLAWSTVFEPGIPFTGFFVAQSVKLGFSLGLAKLAWKLKKS